MSNINNTPANYYGYMKTLAERHDLIKHTENEKHFFRGELEEFYIGLKNKVNFPAMIAEGFTLNYGDNLQRKERESSFIIAEKYTEQKDYGDIDRAFNLCEIIGEEIIRRLLEDEEFNDCATFEAVSAVQIINEMEKYVGIRFTITANSPFFEDINPEMWADL